MPTESLETWNYSRLSHDDEGDDGYVVEIVKTADGVYRVDAGKLKRMKRVNETPEELGRAENYAAARKLVAEYHPKILKNDFTLERHCTSSITYFSDESRKEGVRLTKALDKPWRGDGVIYTLRERIVDGYFDHACMRKVDALKHNRRKLNRMDQAEQNAWHAKNNKGKMEYRLHVAGDADRFLVVTKTIYDYFVGMLDGPITKPSIGANIPSDAHTKCLMRIFDRSALGQSLAAG